MRPFGAPFTLSPINWWSPRQHSVPPPLLPLCGVDAPPAERHLSCFQAVATANKIATNIRVQDFV